MKNYVSVNNMQKKNNNLLGNEVYFQFVNKRILLCPECTFAFSATAVGAETVYSHE
jgi:hypothetical protein